MRVPEYSDQVQVVEVDLALARDKRFTPRNHVLDQRRPDQYRTGRGAGIP